MQCRVAQGDLTLGYEFRAHLIFAPYNSSGAHIVPLHTQLSHSDSFLWEVSYVNESKTTFKVRTYTQEWSSYWYPSVQLSLPISCGVGRSANSITHMSPEVNTLP